MTFKELLETLERIRFGMSSIDDVEVFAESIETDLHIRRVEVKKVYTDGLEPKAKVVLGP